MSTRMFNVVLVLGLAFGAFGMETSAVAHSHGGGGKTVYNNNSVHIRAVNINGGGHYRGAYCRPNCRNGWGGNCLRGCCGQGCGNGCGACVGCGAGCGAGCGGPCGGCGAGACAGCGAGGCVGGGYPMPYPMPYPSPYTNPYVYGGAGAYGAGAYGAGAGTTVAIL